MKNLRDIIATLKSTAEQSKAIVSSPKYHSLKLSLLRATTHDPLTPPDQRQVTVFLSSGQGPRAAASVAVHALMDRLRSSHDAAVSVKCLVLVHHVIRHGSFVLVDQLSVYPSSGGRNSLKLSSFRDDSNTLAWDLSSWVRWYARYLEHQVCHYKLLEPFSCLSAKEADYVREEERISTLINIHLIKEMKILAGLLEETFLMPQSILMGNLVVEHIVGMVGGDANMCMKAIAVRVKELNHRIECLSCSDYMELVLVLNRLDNCYFRMVGLYPKIENDSVWVMLSDLSEKVKMKEPFKELEGKFSGGRSHSLRIGKMLRKYSDSSMFSSARFEGGLV